MILEKSNNTDEKVKSLKIKMKNEIEKQYNKVSLKISNSANELNQTVMVVRKEIDKLKNDLTDILEAKHEAVLH